VLEAADGAEAMRLVEQHGNPVDLLLTDVLMPGMSGRELFERLATRYAGLKVLYISGYTDDTFSRSTGPGSAFLAKPFLLETLASKVRDVLDQ
jgi:CheY-like chemotaxis protein